MTRIKFLLIAITFGYSFSAMSQSTLTLNTTNAGGTVITRAIVTAQITAQTINTSANFSVVIENGITEIADEPVGAFDNYSYLVSATLPPTLTKIGQYAFYRCSGLASINIPNSVKSIGNAAFLGCIALQSITLPQGLTTIGDDAFNGCSALKSIVIPNSIKTIAMRTFNGCIALQSVKLPNGLESIGYEAFRSCSLLTSVTIPASVNNIGTGYGTYNGDVFRECTSLKSVTFESSVPSSITITDNNLEMFFRCDANLTIYVPVGTGDAWKARLLSLNYFDLSDKIVEKSKPILRIGGSLKAGKGTKVIMGPP